MRDRLSLRILENSDLALFREWLGEAHVKQWYEPTEAWIDEIEKRHTDYDFIHYFIAESGGAPVGFGQFYEYVRGGEMWHGDIDIDGAYSIDYLIGRPDCLGKGLGRELIRALTCAIAAQKNARRVIVQPDPANKASCAALLSAGFRYDEKNKLFLYSFFFENAKEHIMRYFDNKCDTLIQKITYNGVTLELVRRPTVTWAGCIGYAADNESESDYMGTLKRFQSLVEASAPQSCINPDWSAAISLNYKRGDRPCGMFFGSEVTSDERNGRYDCLIQPAGLWLRIRNDPDAAALLGKEKADSYEYFAGNLLCRIAEENGYTQDLENNIEIEYNCHAEYSLPEYTGYAYIPVIKK